MDLIKQAINELECEIATKQNTINALRNLAKTEPSPNGKPRRRWTAAQRKAQSLLVKAAWRKRKAARVQNRVKVTKVAAKKG